MSRRIILKLADQPLIGQQETAETVATKIISADFINQSVYVTLNLPQTKSTLSVGDGHTCKSKSSGHSSVYE